MSVPNEPTEPNLGPPAILNDGGTFLLKQLLAVLNEEELIRVRHRFSKRNNVEMAQLISEELEGREGEWA